MDVEKVLEKLAEHNLIRLSRITGKYYTIYCPIHKDGNERKPSCGVLLEEQVKNGKRYPAGWVHCFTCGYAKSLPDLVTDILKSKNMSASGLDWLKEHVPGFDENIIGIEPLIPNSTMVELNSRYALNYISSLTQPKKEFVSEEELASYRYTVDYMYKRGLTDELIEKFDIGFDPNHVPPSRTKPIPCITFPVKDETGNVLFIARRSIEGKYFNYPKDVVKPVYGLYELPEGCRRVVICESIFNAHSCNRRGYHAVALLGTGNDFQATQLRRSGITEFILGFDPDEAGRRATAKWKRILKDVGLVWSFEGIPEGKDLNDLTDEEFDALQLV